MNILIDRNFNNDDTFGDGIPDGFYIDDEATLELIEPWFDAPLPLLRELPRYDLDDEIPF